VLETCCIRDEVVVTEVEIPTEELDVDVGEELLASSKGFGTVLLNP